MITLRIGSTPPTDKPAETREEHRQRAAWHLYELVKPKDGLNWWLLTDAQRERFLGLVRMAERQSDLTAVQAAHEACAKLLANHNDESLETVPPAIRAEYRDRALSLLSLFERVLTAGTPETDEKILELVRHEHSLRDRLRGAFKKRLM